MVTDFLQFVIKMVIVLFIFVFTFVKLSSFRDSVGPTPRGVSESFLRFLPAAQLPGVHHHDGHLAQQWMGAGPEV